MPTTLVTNMTPAVGAGGTVDIIPNAGEEYLIRQVANDSLFIVNCVDVSVALRDAVLADAIIWNDPFVTPNRRAHRQLLLYITHDNYCRLTNTGGAGSNVGYFGEQVQAGLTRADLVTIGAGATIEIQPPAGETWDVTEIGASTWTAAYPDINVIVTDGTLVASVILNSIQLRGWEKQLHLIIDSTTYLAITDTSGAGNVVGYSARRIPQACISSIQDVAGLATLDIIPTANQEWVVTELSAEGWGGAGFPNDYPDMLVSMMVGAVLADLLEAGSVATSLNWNTELELHIDTLHYLRITDVSGANNEIGVLGYLKRSWS